MSNVGKNVSVHYNGTLDDGTKFDSSYDRGEPLEFVCGVGQMIPGFDNAVSEMAVGEKVTVRLEPKDAYGEHDPAGVQSVEIAKLQGSEDLVVGQKVVLQGDNGYPMRAVVVDKTDTEVTFDMNHELAGKALTFEIELLKVK